MYRSHAQDMGRISLVADRQQKVAFAPTASMAVLEEKLGIDLWIGQPMCCGLCQDPFICGAVALLNSVDHYVKGCYALTT
jgi:hypothetical protein